MPRIKPAPGDRRRAFRKTLRRADQEKFDELPELIDDPRPNVDRHDQVGTLTRELRPPTGQADYRGSEWFEELAEALGPKRWFFHKAVHFVELYPTKKDLGELKALGADWSRVWLSFAIHDRQERHALLREAASEDWTIPPLCFTKHERGPAPSPRAGCWRRLPPGRWGSRVCPRQLARLTQPLLDFDAASWRKIKGARWKEFIKDCAGPDRDALLELLRSAEAAARATTAAAAAMAKEVGGLRARARAARK
jgi:hypothetical protein